MTLLLVSASIFVVLSVLLVLFFYWLGNAIKRQARKDITKGKEVHRFFAPIPRPGSFSFVALEGKVKQILENVSGWKLRETKHGECFTLDRNAPTLCGEQSFSDFIGDILKNKLGVIWIGLYATIKVFPKWKWLEIQQMSGGEDGPKYSIVPREEPVSDFLFQFTYPVIVEDAEIKDNIRVRIEAALTVWHLHPVRVFFLNKDVVALFNAMVVGVFRSHVVEKEFREVKSIKASPTDIGASDPSSFWSVLNNLNGITFVDGEPDYENVDPLGLFGKLGMAIVRCEVVQVSGVGETAKALEAARIAELKGEAEVKTAEKAGDALVAKAQREAIALDHKREARKRWIEETVVAPIVAGGDSVGNVLEAEVLASADSKLNVLVQRGAGTGTTIPVGKQ